jgi:predicted transposase/invertase (TIGR01784 family)
MIDLNLIEKGQPYDILNKSYVIFICMSDIFGKGRHIYTFENTCLQDSTLSLGDETTKVFLNPYSDMDDVEEELGNFLKYLADGTVSDSFTQGLSDEVLKVKHNREWRREYMALHLKEQADRQLARSAGLAEGRAEGRVEGRAEGLAEGRAEGRRLVITKLLSKGYTCGAVADMLDIDEDEIKEIQAEILQTT